MKHFRHFATAVLATLLIATGCKKVADDNACGLTCPNVRTTSNFDLTITRAPSNLGAIIVEVSASQRINLDVSGSVAKLAQSKSVDGAEATWRTLIVGGPKSGVIGRISADGAEVPTPNINVIQVAADESGNFQPIATTQVSVTAVRLK